MFPPDEVDQYPDRFIRKTEFTDGFGRLLQTRTQADDTVLDDFGLTADMTAAPGPVRPTSWTPAPPRSWSAAGRPTTTRAGSWRSTSRSSTPAGHTSPPPPPLAASCQGCHQLRPARPGRPHHVYPDGSEQLLVPGIPPDLTDPGSYQPTPWETLHLRQQRQRRPTRPATSAAWSSHWNTPSSDLLDPLGRVIEHAERTAPHGAAHPQRYDIDGNLLQVTDALGRAASASGL